MGPASIVPRDATGEQTRAIADAAVELLSRGPQPVVVHDAALIVRGWNAAAERCFGFTAAEAIGRSLAEFLLPGAAAAAWQAALTGDADAAPTTVACTRKTGGTRACAWRFQAIGGAATSWLCAGEPAREPTLDERVLGAVLDNLPISVWAVDRKGDYLFHDGLGVAQIGVERRSWIGLNLWTLWGDNPGTAETLRNVRLAMDSDQSTHAFAEAMGMVWESWCVPIHDAEGAVDIVVSTTMDITASRRVEAELRARIEQIEAQQQIIRDLATPIIEIWDGVLTVPLMGSVDSERTTELMERTLAEVVRVRARHTILDLTGVEVVDARTAGYLIDLVRSIRLLGAEAIITGIRPSVAQIFVSLGSDLRSIPTRSNLRSGLEYCMQKASARRPTNG